MRDYRYFLFSDFNWVTLVCYNRLYFLNPMQKEIYCKKITVTLSELRFNYSVWFIVYFLRKEYYTISDLDMTRLTLHNVMLKLCNESFSRKKQLLMNVLIQKLHLEGNLDGQNALKVYLHDFFFSRYQRKWEQSYRKNGRFVKCNSSCMGCITVFHQEVANNEHGVGPRIVAMQDPRGGGSGSDTDDAFSLSFEYLNAKSSSDNILYSLYSIIFSLVPHCRPFSRSKGVRSARRLRRLLSPLEKPCVARMRLICSLHCYRKLPWWVWCVSLPFFTSF